MRIEIKFEQEANLDASSLSSEELTFEQLKIQLRATGLRRGIEYAAHYRARDSKEYPRPASIRFPCSLLENLNAFKRLTASAPEKAPAFIRQLRDLYIQSYEEGLAQGHAKRAEFNSSKRKAEHAESPEKKCSSKRRRHLETNQNREKEEQEQSEEESEVEKRSSTKRKKPESTKKTKPENKAPKLEAGRGRYGLFANSNRDSDSDVEEQQTQTTPATAQRGSPAFFEFTQSTSPDAETKNGDLSP